MALRDIQAITTLKRDAARLIAEAAERRSPLVITQNGEATAVLQDVESYERRQRAFLLLKLLAQGERDFESGRTLSQSDISSRVDDLLQDIEKE